MAKSIKKKDAETASNVFHSIIAASVKGNPKPKKDNSLDIINHIKAEIEMVVPDYQQYLILQIRMPDADQISYHIDEDCPKAKAEKIEKVILENASLLNIPVCDIDDIE